MEAIVKLLETKQVTHDVKQFRLAKPKGYFYIPGQATEISINQPEWTSQTRPFTFTGLNEDPYLQFTIKRYPDRHGVTDKLHELKPGDEIIVRDVWGAIEYRGPGCFLAGGAGITPFLAIFRRLHKDGQIGRNTLYFSNKTAADIIEHQELLDILGVRANFLLTRDSDASGYYHGRIDRTFLEDQLTTSDLKRPFYLCGTDEMVHDLSAVLTDLGASPETLVVEK